MFVGNLHGERIIRFFVGCQKYRESALEVAVHLGLYQPIACARSLALKQCISLPKPLWHEGENDIVYYKKMPRDGLTVMLVFLFAVMELCGGELGDLSELELSSTDDIQFQVVDESEMDEDDDDEDEEEEDDDDDEEMSESDSGLDEDEDDFYWYF